VAVAGGRPARVGAPFTRWSIRKLRAYLAADPEAPIRIGRETLRMLLARRGVTFQRTRTWKESPDPRREAKLAAIEDALERHAEATFAFDEFGPLGIRPVHGAGWARAGHRWRLAATYHRTEGVTYFHGCYSVGKDRLWGSTGGARARPTRCSRSRASAAPAQRTNRCTSSWTTSRRIRTGKSARELRRTG
jgi:hypothetical protein